MSSAPRLSSSPLAETRAPRRTTGWWTRLRRTRLTPWSLTLLLLVTTPLLILALVLLAALLLLILLGEGLMALASLALTSLQWLRRTLRPTR